jgi:hypothetical protein
MIDWPHEEASVEVPIMIETQAKLNLMAKVRERERERKREREREFEDEYPNISSNLTYSHLAPPLKGSTTSQ